MHQQLSLYASAQHQELKITLHTLSALSGMHPKALSQHCLVWKPQNPFNPVLKAGEVNQIEQYRITMTNDEPEGKLQPFKEQESYNELKTREWSMRISEVPETGKRPVVSQSLLNAKINEGDPFRFMNDLGYTFEFEYWIRGYRFVFGAIVLNLFRIGTLTKSTKNDEEASQGESKEDAMEVDNDESAAVEELKLVDDTGRWTVKAHIDVQNLTDMGAIKSATQQLERLQTDLAGLLDLKVIERVSLDTRVLRR